MATKGRQLFFLVLWILSVLVNGVLSVQGTSSHFDDSLTVTSVGDTTPTETTPALSESSTAGLPIPTSSSMVDSSSSSAQATSTSISAPPSSSPTDVALPSTSVPAISLSTTTPAVSSSATTPATPVPATSGISLAGIVGIAVAAAVSLLLVVVVIIVAVVVCHFTVNRKGHYATKEDDIRETSLLRHNASLRSVKSTVSKQETEYYL